jgi:hypothetical protein
MERFAQKATDEMCHVDLAQWDATTQLVHYRTITGQAAHRGTSTLFAANCLDQLVKSLLILPASAK